MNESRIDLNALQVLVTVVQAGGFSAAARRLGVPPNRLSRQVQRLEEVLGVRLLQRTTRRLSLTTVGRTLVDHAEPALQDLESLWRLAGTRAQVPSGHLRVAAPADFMAVVSAQRLARFLERYPLVSLEIVLSDDPVDLYSSGMDAALRAGPIHDESLVARRLTPSKLLLVANPTCIATHGTVRNVQDVGGYPCITLRSKEGRSTWTLVGPEGAATVAIRARLTVNGMGALVAAALAGLGAALVPEQLVAEHLLQGTLVRLLPDYCVDGGGIYVVYPSRRHPPAALKAFIDFVVSEAEQA